MPLSARVPLEPDFHPQAGSAGDAFIAEQRRGLGDWVGHAFTAAIRRLERVRSESTSPLQRTTCIELMAELGANRTEWESRIVAAFDAAIDADLKEEDGADEPAALPIRLELIDEGNVDEEIAVSRLIQAAEAAAEGALREIGFVWGRRAPTSHGVCAAYPMRPAVIGRAFRKAVAGLGLPSEHRLLLLNELGAAIAGTLAPVYERQHEALCELDPGQPAIELSLRTMSQGLVPLGGEFDAQADGPRPPLRPARQARSALQELRTGLGAPDGANPGEAMADLMRLVTQRIPPGEYLENVVRRLAGPACRIAEQTPAIWQTSDHPLWHLLDRLLAAGSVHTDLSDGLPDDVQALELALRALEEAGAPREGDCMAVEMAVDTAVSELRDLRPEAVADQIDEMQERLGRSDIEAALRSQIGEQLRRSTAALPVRHFLLDTWTQVMAASAQQRGVDSDPFRAQAALVDELAAAAERCRTGPLPASEIARLIAHVRLALTEAGFASQRIGVELSALARALRKPAPGAAEPAPARPPAPAAETSAPRAFRRSRIGADSRLPGVGPGAQPPAAAPADPTPLQAAELGLHDALATVPLDHLDPAQADAQGASAPNAEAWLDSLLPGSYCRLFLLERWMNTQLTWRSDNGSMFIFASRHQGRSHSLSRRSLVKLRNAGLAATIERGESIAEVMAELARQRGDRQERARHSAPRRQRVDVA